MKPLTPTPLPQSGRGRFGGFWNRNFKMQPLTLLLSPQEIMRGEEVLCEERQNSCTIQIFDQVPTRLTLMDFTCQKTLKYPFNCAVNMRMTNTREASDNYYHSTSPHRQSLWGRVMLTSPMFLLVMYIYTMQSGREIKFLALSQQFCRKDIFVYTA